MKPLLGRGWYHRGAGQAVVDMATSPSPASFFVRLDPRLGEGLQQQIYGSVRRAILEGVLAPGTRIPSSRALATDLGVSRTTTLLAVQQLQAEGYVTARRGSGTSVAAELPDDLVERSAARPATRPKHPALSRRGAAVAAVQEGARRLVGPPRAFRLGTPGVDLFPVGLWSRLASRRLRSVTSAQLDYGDPAGLRALREAIASHVQTARGTRCEADQVVMVAGAQQGFELVCRLLAGSGRPRVDGGAGLSRSAERPPGGGRADRSRARGCPGPGRRSGGPGGPVTPVSPT